MVPQTLVVPFLRPISPSCVNLTQGKSCPSIECGLFGAIVSDRKSNTRLARSAHYRERDMMQIQKYEALASPLLGTSDGERQNKIRLERIP